MGAVEDSENGKPDSRQGSREAQPKSLREIAGVYQEVFLNIEKRMDGQYPTAHIVTAFNMGFRFRTRRMPRK